MTAFIKKLKSKAGESLIESLCAILIFTMASIVMFSMVSAANDINGEAKEQDAKNQAHLVAVEKGENKSGEGTVQFVINGDNDLSVSVDVYGGADSSGNSDGSLYAYFVKPQGG